ncbi:MAG TPA: glycosyltransferase [Casimicrobiaceae bacterium]|nr:glycosyltransferase [Casimicrobiaceae bacterium]
MRSRDTTAGAMPDDGAAATRDAELPSISVVVPTWNRPRELASCLAALAAADYPVERYEVVVVDDGSSPPVAPIADPGRPGLRVTWLRQANRGPSAARNLGARHATGAILAFTDDDCEPAREWLRALAAAVTAAPEAMQGGRVVNGLPRNPYAAASQTITDVVIPSLLDARSPLRFVTSNNLALAAEAFRSIGGFDETFRAAEDREFCHRWVAAGRPIALASAAVVHHRHDLTLGSYWRQHVGYGRGAWRFHRHRASQGHGPLRPELALFLKAFRRPFETRSPVPALAVAALLVVWQVANAAGYLRERGWPNRGRIET